VNAVMARDSHATRLGSAVLLVLVALAAVLTSVSPAEAKKGRVLLKGDLTLSAQAHEDFEAAYRIRYNSNEAQDVNVTIEAPEDGMVFQVRVNGSFSYEVMSATDPATGDTVAEVWLDTDLSHCFAEGSESFFCGTLAESMLPVHTKVTKIEVLDGTETLASWTK
jgi:hypothetical protein